MIEVREASETDVTGISDLFHASYGKYYTYPGFYDPQVLKKMVFDDDTLLLVAEDTENEMILGTASVLFDLGAFGDLAGEFGRLVVHPEGRQKGIGKKLMAARLEGAGHRLHIGFVENRVTHPFSQRISAHYDFAAAGFLPLKALFDERESLALYLRLFGDALALRRNNPRVIPEAFQLAQCVLNSCGMEPDVIVDDASPSYPDERQFDLEEIHTKGYASLLRFARAKSKKRDVFGPARIHQGMFRLRSSRSDYVIARKDGHLAGAIGYSVDRVEKAVKIFEVVTVDETPIRMLVKEVIKRCRKDFDLAYIEADVSAYSPGMQRTLLELQFVPVAYKPAMAFRGAERCDAIRMVRLFVPVKLDGISLYKATQPVFDIVMSNFTTRALIPRLADAIPMIGMFSGLTPEQIRLLAGICSIDNFKKGEEVVKRGQIGERALIMLEGELGVMAGEGGDRRSVGVIGTGECFGETTLLNREEHSVTAIARTDIEAAVIANAELTALLRRRPDIGVTLYRNLAQGLGKKLRDLDAEVAHFG